MAEDILQTGQLPLNAPLSKFNELNFLITQELSRLQTATLVRVESCTNNGGLDPVGFVDVTPMVYQVDSENNAVPHKTIFNIPYSRIQGGSNALIIDPSPGDIGFCVFANRDISKIKTTRSPGMPGSNRQFNFSDGLYLGGLLNGIPTQFIRMGSDGITIQSPTKITLNAPDIDINAINSVNIVSGTAAITAATTIDGSFDKLGPSVSNFGGDVVTGGISSRTHVHGGVTSGLLNTSGPV
jgi:hypothetical protein